MCTNTVSFAVTTECKTLQILVRCQDILRRTIFNIAKNIVDINQSRIWEFAKGEAKYGGGLATC